MRAATTFVTALVLGLGLAACQSREVQADVTTDEPTAGQAAESTGSELPKAADFTLEDTTGKEHTLSDYLGKDKLVILEWFNPDCPFVVAYHQKTSRMADTYEALGGAEGVTWLAINSGAPGKQGAGLDRNKRAVDDYEITYPVLLDETGEVGRKYGAKTTPHMYVISPEGHILYAGAIDDSGGRGEPETNLVLAAIEDHEAGRPVATPTHKPFGCSVKYAD